MTSRLIILNGGSSSGKSEIVRCLQAELPDQWLAFGCDSFVDALPARMRESDSGIAITTDGDVSIGADFLALEAAWREGIVAMVRAGARVVIDDVFLGGSASQQRWRKALDAGSGSAPLPVPVLWVGVRCASGVAARREVARGDRALGMAAAQADVVHEGVVYDLEVDTSHSESLACARAIAARVHGGE
ncbi:chloramphenicol phosphotransferase CPT [Streptomyces graminilatus]|uniref:chloramphenicol phosphotransferase CPT n=1 Tax=Streptomyces graminilatus TaxID=1464070 RepID=UPI0007C7EDC1|nr:chloramphenicol phosphotransferase CPT [Streptomyces graminilatus]